MYCSTGLCAVSRKTICTLDSGKAVTYLGSYINSSEWAYVEPHTNGKPVRGFIPLDRVNVKDMEEE